MCPGENQSKKRPGFKGIVFILFWGVFFLLLIGLTLYVSGIKRNAHRELRSVNQSYQAVNQRYSRIEETKKRRILFLEKQFFLMHPARFSLHAVRLMGTLSRITPRWIDLIELKMIPRNRNLEFSLKGVATSADFPGAEEGFGEFFSRLKAVQGIVRLSRKPGATGAPAGFFHFQGECEIQ